MTRRCVITGMGVVSPNAVGTKCFQDAILQGRSGVKRISRFDASEIDVQIAGEVSDFDELAWVGKIANMFHGYYRLHCAPQAKRWKVRESMLLRCLWKNDAVLA